MPASSTNSIETTAKVETPLLEGTYIVPDISTKKPEITKTYKSNWNGQNPFKVKGKLYNQNATGISFSGGHREAYAPYVCFTVDNLASYNEVSFLVGEDDISSGKSGFGVGVLTISGTYKALKLDEYTREEQENGFEKATIPTKGYSKMYL